MRKPAILIVEDDPDGCRSVTEAIEDLGFEVVTATRGEEGVRRFGEGRFDTVLCDLVLPDIDGIEVLSRIRRSNDQVPVIIMTAYSSVPSSVKAFRSGAYDYITKPLDLDDLQSKIRRAVETMSLRDEVTQLQQSIHGRYSAAAMVAHSPAMQRILGHVKALANANASVLIRGESGTGKELIARALHVDGRRANGPFVGVNCGAFAETLLESELFGHEKGAFTGANIQRKGAFERADQGTLFLDEIGDAPKSVQVKLLRVLEEREVTRVGGQSPVPVDVRLVSASNKDLEALIESGEFREDLLYRLKVVTIEIPPLRERREDIRLLTDRFIALACEENGRTIASVEPEYYRILEGGDWPGNVRQLRNVVESSVVMSSERILHASDIHLETGNRRPETGLTIPEGMTFAELEREALSQTLRRYQGNRTLSAEKMGISRRTIQRKIQEYNLPF